MVTPMSYSLFGYVFLGQAWPVGLDNFSLIGAVSKTSPKA
jgi:hypothetical protein